MTGTPILDPAALAAMLRARKVQLVDVRSDADWRAATIPGAMRLEAYDYFIPASDDSGVRGMARAAASAFARLGIDGSMPVVFFEQATGMISPRALWFHDLLGLAQGHVLDGGFDAWRHAGLPVAPGTGLAAAIDPAAADGALPASVQPQLAATLDQVRAADGRSVVVLDTRRPTEHTGAFVHPCCARPGRIPGSVLLFWEDVLADGRYRDAAELRRIFRNAGLSPGQEVITYCHRGARAATVFHALRRAGFSRARVFVGSWHEWAARGELPASCG
jgi:thiosulfate/3-mercaptopyruvate sulfurtransferase